MSNSRAAFLNYLTDRESRRALVESIHSAFRDRPAFCDAMDEALREIRSALSAGEVLVTCWDDFDERFRSFWASGVAKSESLPIPPSSGELFRLVDARLPGSMFGKSVLNEEFGGLALDSAVNAPIWIHGNLKAVLSILDIHGLSQQEDHLDKLDGLIQELANTLGEEIDRSLGFGLSKQKLENGEYSLAHLLHRGTKWIAAIFGDLRGSTPAMETLGLHGTRMINISGAHVSLPKPSRLIKEYCNCIAEKLCIHGRIDKFVGDAAVGIVGDLFEETDDQKTVLRAICTATMMYDAFQEIVADWNDPEHENYWIPEFRKYFNEDIDLRIGIGINYGPVIFDFFGSDDHKEYTAIGDTINTAERLEELASKPSESGRDYEPILISQTMFMRAESFISNYKPYMLTLRGKARPVSACGIREFDRDACMALVQCKDCPGGQWTISREFEDLRRAIGEVLRGPMLDKFNGFVTAQFTDKQGNPLPVDGSKVQAKVERPYKLVVSIQTAKPSEGKKSGRIDISEGNDEEEVSFLIVWDSGTLEADKEELAISIAPTRETSVERDFDFITPETVRTHEVYIQVYQSNRFIQAVKMALDVTNGEYNDEDVG